MIKKEIKNSDYIKDGEIGIAEMSVTYMQEADTNDNPDNIQVMKLTAIPGDSCMVEYDPQNPIYYINIEIEPNEDGTPGHWSVSEFEDLRQIFDDFMQRLINNKKKE